LRKVYAEDHALLADNFRAYINGFSKNVDDIIEHFNYRATIGTMVKNNRLAPILNQYKELELGPDKLSPLEMGYIYEELLRRFSEQSGEEAGEHFTPREVIRLMVELLEIPIPDRHLSIYDPACGTGGMLSVAKDVGGGEKGYQFGGRGGARCGVTLWPPVGAEIGKKRTASSLRPDCPRFWPEGCGKSCL
jgi:type I restriction enzyme M protein